MGDVHDKVLKCVECKAEFVFTVGEQLFFIERGFTNDPKRCKPCKLHRGKGAVYTETNVTCSGCGADTTVPFKPSQGRPVLCRTCYLKKSKEDVSSEKSNAHS